MLNGVFAFVSKLVETVLNWTSPFFLGKVMSDKKWEELSRGAENEAAKNRIDVHRETVNSSDASGSRDKLREWSRGDD